MPTVREEQQLDEIVALVRGVLGGAALGGSLFGSAVAGGLRPDSDLDVLVVADRRLRLPEKRALAVRLADISRGPAAPPGSRPVEVTIVVQAEVRPWQPPGRFDFQYGNWLREDFAAGRFEPWPDANPDVATLITMARQAGRALFGPPPAALLEAIPHAALIEAMAAGLDPLLADLEWDTRNVLLTLARAWFTVATGEIAAKDAAAGWAAERLPATHRGVLAYARAAYLGETLGDRVERWDDFEGRGRPTAEALAREIRAGAAAILTR